MRILVSALAGALLMAAPAGATLTRNPGLEQYAQQVRGTHVDVWCESDQQVWDANVDPRALGETFYVGQYTLLAPSECAGLAAPKATELFDVAAYVLTHEVMHTAGVTDEGAAECWALYIFRYELRRNLGYTKAQAQTAWERAWVKHLSIPGPFYRGTCTQEAADPFSYANGLRL